MPIEIYGIAVVGGDMIKPWGKGMSYTG